ncbi:MAG: hypothetical protein Q4D14_04495 [Bacteroidales bacterium]|nr:hypothetical protein [Bacteroidales bacterium]
MSKNEKNNDSCDVIDERIKLLQERIRTAPSYRKKGLLDAVIALRRLREALPYVERAQKLVDMDEAEFKKFADKG